MVEPTQATITLCLNSYKPPKGNYGVLPSVECTFNAAIIACKISETSPRRIATTMNQVEVKRIENWLPIRAQ